VIGFFDESGSGLVELTWSVSME